MFPINESIKPAVQSHLNAQLSFFNDMTQTLFDSFQKISELNLQLAHSLVEDGAQAGRDMVAAKRPDELLAATTGQAQPMADKLRAYKEHLAQLATQAQTSLTQCAEQHAPETSRTGKALAEEIIKAAASEGQKALQRQQGAMHNVAEQIKTQGEAAAKSQGDAFRSGDGRVQDDGAAELRRQQDTMRGQQDAMRGQAEDNIGEAREASEEVLDDTQSELQKVAHAVVNGTGATTNQADKAP